MNSNYFISILIPVHSVNTYIINENLPHLSRQTFKNFEVILLPNNRHSTDKELLKKYKFLKIIETKNITRPGQKRNIGVKHAKGNIVAFIDDDAYPRADWLENAVKIFKRNKIAALCGPGILPKKVNFWEKTFDEILKRKMGAGLFTYRFVPKKERYIDDFPSMNFLIKKEIFTELGGFNNDYWPGEDSKLCEDIVNIKKEKLLYSPEIVVFHHRRNSLTEFLKQHGSYGFHRGAFFAHGDVNSRRLLFLIPTLFSFYLLLLCVSIIRLQNPVLLNILVLPLIMYLIGILYVFMRALFFTRNLIIALVSAVMLPPTHINYGIQFVKGFINGLRYKENIYGNSRQ